MAKVETERRGRAIIVTIDRPEVRNCVDGEPAVMPRGGIGVDLPIV